MSNEEREQREYNRVLDRSRENRCSNPRHNEIIPEGLSCLPFDARLVGRELNIPIGESYETDGPSGGTDVYVHLGMVALESDYLHIAEKYADTVSQACSGKTCPGHTDPSQCYVRFWSLLSNKHMHPGYRKHLGHNKD